MAVHINHLGISVPNLANAVKWYSENLGFRVLKEQVHFKRNTSIDRRDDTHIFRVYDEPFQEAKIAYLLSGNGVGIELFEFIEPKHQKTLGLEPDLYTRTGCYHVAITDPNPASLCLRLEEAGAKKIGEAVKLGPGLTIQYIQDPCGLILEICSETFEKGLLQI